MVSGIIATGECPLLFAQTVSCLSLPSKVAAWGECKTVPNLLVISHTTPPKRGIGGMGLVSGKFCCDLLLHSG